VTLSRSIGYVPASGVTRAAAGLVSESRGVRRASQRQAGWALGVPVVGSQLLEKYGSDAAVKAAAGRMAPLLNAIGADAAGGGAVNSPSGGGCQ
jgi:hypothetical protein